MTTFYVFGLLYSQPFFLLKCTQLYVGTSFLKSWELYLLIKLTFYFILFEVENCIFALKLTDFLLSLLQAYIRLKS